MLIVELSRCFVRTLVRRDYHLAGTVLASGLWDCPSLAGGNCPCICRETLDATRRSATHLAGWRTLVKAGVDRNGRPLSSDSKSRGCSQCCRTGRRSSGHNCTVEDERSDRRFYALASHQPRFREMQDLHSHGSRANRSTFIVHAAPDPMDRGIFVDDVRTRPILAKKGVTTATGWRRVLMQTLGHLFASKPSFTSWIICRLLTETRS